MTTLVDTSVWSLALRRTTPADPEPVRELGNLIDAGEVECIGPIRQELLSGIRDERQFRALRAHLRAFRDLRLGTEDFELAAEFHNRCARAGIQGSHVDFLICAVAVRRRLRIFTLDRDFARFRKLLPIRLHNAGGTRT
jgi:predicted nucleic acid-binding protein